MARQIEKNEGCWFEYRRNVCALEPTWTTTRFDIHIYSTCYVSLLITINWHLFQIFNVLIILKNIWPEIYKIKTISFLLYAHYTLFFAIYQCGVSRQKIITCSYNNFCCCFNCTSIYLKMLTVLCLFVDAVNLLFSFLSEKFDFLKNLIKTSFFNKQLLELIDITLSYISNNKINTILVVIKSIGEFSDTLRCFNLIGSFFISNCMYLNHNLYYLTTISSNDGWAIMLSDFNRIFVGVKSLFNLISFDSKSLERVVILMISCYLYSLRYFVADHIRWYCIFGIGF